MSETDPLLVAAALTDLPKKPTTREMRMLGYSDETKRAIRRSIEANPAMEETILVIAELAYGDGEENAYGDR